MNYRNLIKELLKNRGFETEAEMDEFLHPSLASFHNPFLLSGMKEATSRIKSAIKNNEKIVIYGDYDCDGICAVSILYLYLKSQGNTPIGFIPSRHTDGYGLSIETVNFIKKEYNPSLVITVDTGISAYKEIELFKSLGVDVIVTDHHEPPAEIPNTIVVDAKIPGQDYPFNGLSGAGIAFKLVQAMSGLDEALKYADITAISTVGDIVPLLNENRIIVKEGLKLINSKTPRPSIGYIKSKLKLKTLNSTDIAFKLVPRLNACGRISTAEKCFKFMVEEKGTELEKYYAEIEADNTLRLDLSAKIFEKIDKSLKSIDLNHEKAVFIRDDEINLGLIGIVASRLVSSLNRPVFVFSSDEAGNLKASVRSIEGINIFNILDSHRDLMIDVGGHSLAGGLTIAPINYDALKNAVIADLKDVDATVFKAKKEAEFDAIITEKDINLSLANLLEELEPYGFMNPRPVFKLSSSTTSYLPMKSIKHFRIGLNKTTEIVSFFGGNLVPYFLTPSNKDMLLTLEVDNFFSKPRAKAMIKSLSSDNYHFKDEKDYSQAKEIYYLSSCLNLRGGWDFKTKSRLTKEDIADFGCLIVTNSSKVAEELSKTFNLKIVLEPLSSGESVVVYNPHRALQESSLNMYKRAFVFSAPNTAEYLRALGLDVVLVGENKLKINLNLDRESFKNAYILITKQLKINGNNFFEIVENLEKKTKLSPQIIVAVIKISEELGFYSLSEADGLIELVAEPQKNKNPLENSAVYNKIK